MHSDIRHGFSTASWFSAHAAQPLLFALLIVRNVDGVGYLRFSACRFSSRRSNIASVLCWLAHRSAWCGVTGCLTCVRQPVQSWHRIP